MAVMMGIPYEALKPAGADGAAARRAAEEVASYDDRIAHVKGGLIPIRGELTLVKWMLGFNVAMTVAIVGRSFLAGH